MPPRWLDLAKGRLRLDRLCRNGSARLSSPGLATPQARGDPGSPIPREPRKSRRCHPPLCSGPKSGAAAITFGLQIAIEAAMVAGSDSQES
jgi:hypothetical protein